MTPDERSERVVRAIEATVSGDTSAVGMLFTAEVEARSPTVSVSSRVELAVELEDSDDEFSEVEIDARTVVCSGNRVCTEWVASATHTTALPPRRVTLLGATVADFDGDQICSIRHYWDQVALLGELRSPPS